MRKLLLALLLALSPALAAAQVSGPTYTFTINTIINPDEVNSNFSTIYANALNRTGGTMTGTLTTRAIIADTNNSRDIGASGTRYANIYSVLGNFSGAVTMASTAAITGNTTIGGTLGVTGNTTIGGTLVVGNRLTVTAPNADAFAMYLQGRPSDNIGAVRLTDTTGGTEYARYQWDSSGLILSTGASGTPRLTITNAGYPYFATNLGVGTSVEASRLNISIGGATADSANYGRGIQITGPAATTGQMMSFVRQGTRVWSLGYDYNGSALVIGGSQVTDANFTATAGAVVIRDGNQVQFPQQPGFSAYNSASDSYSGVSSVSPVDLDTESFDTAGNFAADVFTAPIAGIYEICGSVGISNTGGVGEAYSLSIETSSPGTHYVDTVVFTTIGVQVLNGCIHASLAAGATANLRVVVDTSPADFDIVGGAFASTNTRISGRLLP